MTRWKRRLLLGALAVLVPALAGCEAGYNAPTLEYHQAAFGAYAMKNGVSISNAFVLGPSLSGPEVAGGRAGVFLAITSQDGDKLVSASAPGTATAVQIAGVTLGPKSTPAAPVRPFVTSVSAARMSHPSRPSASSSKPRPSVGTPLPSSPGAPR